MCEQGSRNGWCDNCSMDLQSHQTGSQQHQSPDAVKGTEGSTAIEVYLFDPGKSTEVVLETCQRPDVNQPDLADVRRYARRNGSDGLAPLLEAGLFSECDESEVVFLGSIDPSHAHCRIIPDLGLGCCVELCELVDDLIYEFLRKSAHFVVE